MCTVAEVFLPYLDEWETSVSERSGFTKIEKGMMLLSRETRLGLKITGWLQMTTKIYSNLCENTAFVLFYCLCEIGF